MNQQDTLTLTVYSKMHDEQRRLLRDIEELYALVNVCRLALARQGQGETDSTSMVLMLAVNALFDLQERETKRAAAIKMLANPFDAVEATHE
jgi:cell division protein ZapA (FtsZ GTPase activity inhibitor)